MITQIKKSRLHRLKKKIAQRALVLLMLCWASHLENAALAKEPAQKDKAKEKIEGEAQKKVEKLIKHTTEPREIVGEVTWLGKDRISVLFSSDDASGTEYEMLIPFEKNVAVEHKRNLGEIKTGDTVRIKYEEDLKQYDTNREEVSRKAKVIGFVRAGAKKPAPKEEVIESEPLVQE